MSDLEVVAEPGKHDLVITRSFDAPRELVFNAYADPEAIPQWWSPAKYTTTVDYMDAEDGGGWRFISKDSDGNEFPFRGVFHEVKAPERIIQTFEFELAPGHVALETMQLEERDGRTFMTSTSVFQSVEDRDGMLETGMEEGLRESYVRLDELLKSQS